MYLSSCSSLIRSELTQFTPSPARPIARVAPKTNSLLACFALELELHATPRAAFIFLLGRIERRAVGGCSHFVCEPGSSGSLGPPGFPGSPGSGLLASPYIYRLFLLCFLRGDIERCIVGSCYVLCASRAPRVHRPSWVLRATMHFADAANRNCNKQLPIGSSTHANFLMRNSAMDDSIGGS